ncbi:hypothetical protein TELCIR_03137 [Teladorsagia circumcincta]|uniref:PDZ domain-containing protein n=1 Tax=Teladorsagia circumcincta TaxID=45464 RepID=A0A2G9UYN2_TELCI|nr:hypothetical protein TELCIR_03137 [Teladorsagia circumcincta]
MLFQEHKDTRLLRRWFHKRLQIELNDISTRSAAGRLIQEIRIRDLSLGTKFPRINAIRVENVEMAEDKNIFDKITLLIDMDYTGGLETSIDVTTVFGKKANLSIKTAINANGSRPVRVAIVEEGSLADKAAFKPGDTLLAINNVPIRSERQVVRFLQQTIGDLLILVDRNLDDIDDEGLKDSESVVGSTTNGNNDDGFVCLGEVATPPATVAERRSVSPGGNSFQLFMNGIRLRNVPSFKEAVFFSPQFIAGIWAGSCGDG